MPPSSVHIVSADPAPLREGEARLKIESFSVTANNVTYAVAGDAFGYWNFFPGEEGWGVVPMWGHAFVEASNHPEIAEAIVCEQYGVRIENITVRLADVVLP